MSLYSAVRCCSCKERTPTPYPSEPCGANGLLWTVWGLTGNAAKFNGSSLVFGCPACEAGGGVWAFGVGDRDPCSNIFSGVGVNWCYCYAIATGVIVVLYRPTGTNNAPFTSFSAGSCPADPGHVYATGGTGVLSVP